MITRWDEWFSDSNLAMDKRILSAPPSRSAQNAVGVFLASEKRLILDLACGVGRDTFYLAGCGLNVIGVDASFRGLQVAQQAKSERGEVSGLVAADGRHLPFKDCSFEGVYCFGLLHEFIGEGREEDVDEIMGEVKRLMCDDGLLVLAVLAGEPQAGLPHVQLYTRQMFREATKEFREIEVKRYEDIGCTGRGDYPVWCGIFKN